MAELAYVEQAPPYWQPELVEPPLELPLVINVAELLPTDIRAEKLIRSIGETAAGPLVEAVPAPETSITSLHDGIQKAAKGDETARKLVKANAHTDAVERTLKAGHVLTPVELEETPEGEIFQNGQTLEQIQANTVEFASDMPEMVVRIKPEVRNAFRLQNVNRLNLLDDYWFVVLSRAADNMTEAQMEEANFFVDTMSMAVYGTTKQDGKPILESAFVAGKKSAGAARHDADMVIQFGEKLNVKLSDQAAEVIDTPLLIHKSLIPNGMIDVVKLLDEAEGTFFGEDKPRQDYLQYRQQCIEREKGFEAKADAIAEDLIAEAGSIKDPVMATRRLHKLSEEHMLEKTVEDLTINPRVFGAPAAWHIEQARWLQAQGDTRAVQQHMLRAKATAKSVSCPGSSGRQDPAKIGTELEDITELSEQSEQNTDCPEVKNGDRVTCPYCNKKVTAIVPDRKTIYCSNSECKMVAPSLKKQ